MSKNDEITAIKVTMALMITFIVGVLIMLNYETTAVPLVSLGIGFTLCISSAFFLGLVMGMIEDEKK